VTDFSPQSREQPAVTGDHPRIRGNYTRLANRAQEKLRALKSHGVQNLGSMDAAVAEEDLLRRYLENRLCRPVAANLTEHCRASGYADEERFRRAILREYCYTGFSK